MKDLVKKVAVGIVTGTLVAQSMVLPSLGAISVVVSGNGSDSDNTVNVDQDATTQVTQTNTANVENNIKATSNTGGNDADDNTGGDVNIDTGNAKSLVEVSNTLNSNEAHVDCKSCPTDLNVEVSGNGTDSDNDVKVDLDNTTWVTQTNYANVENDVDVDANSGDNDADDNTGGSVDIDTGSATAWASVSTQANANVAHVGNGGGEGSLDVLITGNGSESNNDIDLDLDNTVGIVQTNWLNLENDVEVDADSGNNDADDNTGGAVSIDTGSAWAGATVDTQANFNLAHVEDCCELDGLVKVAGNGTDSDNDVELDLASTLYSVQDNDYTCGDQGGWLEFWWDWFRDDCDVEAKANSGDNSVDDSTGEVDGDPSIDTGSATTEVEVNTEANSNVFSTGDALPEVPEFDMDGSMSWLVWLLMGQSS